MFAADQTVLLNIKVPPAWCTGRPDCNTEEAPKENCRCAGSCEPKGICFQMGNRTHWRGPEAIRLGGEESVISCHPVPSSIWSCCPGPASNLADLQMLKKKGNTLFTLWENRRHGNASNGWDPEAGAVTFHIEFCYGILNASIIVIWLPFHKDRSWGSAIIFITFCISFMPLLE